MRQLAKSSCVKWPSVNACTGQIGCVPTPRRKGKPDFKKPANSKEYNVAEKADQACEKVYTLDEVVDELGLCCVKEAKNV